jgi:hypothetical protein
MPLIKLLSQLPTTLSALASRAAGCRVATSCPGTNLPTSAVQRFRPLLGVQRKGLAQLSFVCP